LRTKTGCDKEMTRNLPPPLSLKRLTKPAAAFLLLVLVGFVASSAALFQILFDFQIWGQ